MQRILLCLTPQVPYDRAARQAAALARHFGAELSLLHVAQTGDGAALWAQLDDAHLFDGIAVSRQVRQGRPIRHIIAAACLQNADLIVLATHDAWRAGAEMDEEFLTASQRVFQRFLLNSVAAQVIDEAPCPVLAVPALPGGGPQTLAPRLLCHIDLRTHSRAVLARGAAFAAATGTELALMHVTVSTQIFTAGRKTAHTQMWADNFAQSAAARIAELQTEAGTAAPVLIASGEAGAALAGAATEATMLAGGHWLAREHWEDRSQMFAIIRRAPVPVLIFNLSRPQSAARYASAATSPRLRRIRRILGFAALAGMVLLIWMMATFAIEFACWGDPTIPACRSAPQLSPYPREKS